MSDQPSLARAATELLSNSAYDDRPPTAEARRDAIEVIARALAARERTRRVRRVGLGVAASLAIAAGALFIVRARPTLETAPLVAVEGSAVLMHEGAQVVGPRALVTGDRIVASSSGAVVLGTGTRMSFEGGSELAVATVGKNAQFDLRAGKVRFDVTKLASGERFVVRTVDTEVEVWGTSFSVGLAAPEARCGAMATRVVVKEGVVAVRYGGEEKRLVAGDSWPVCTPAVDETKTSPPPVSPTIAATTTKANAPTPSELAAQNDLFAAGITAKRNGNREGAIASFDRLLSKWPASPLAENASAERMRLSSGARATSYARAYLLRWPHGFAAHEAKLITSASP